MGSKDLVKAWTDELEKAYGLSASFYPMRGDKSGLRAYLDIDDRQAKKVINSQSTKNLN